MRFAPGGYVSRAPNDQPPTPPVASSRVRHLHLLRPRSHRLAPRQDQSARRPPGCPCNLCPHRSEQDMLTRLQGLGYRPHEIQERERPLWNTVVRDSERAAGARALPHFRSTERNPATSLAFSSSGVRHSTRVPLSRPISRFALGNGSYLPGMLRRYSAPRTDGGNITERSVSDLRAAVMSLAGPSPRCTGQDPAVPDS